MTQNKKRQFINGLLLAVLLVSFFTLSFNTQISSAESLSSLRSRAAALQAEIDANNKQAEKLDREGDSLRAAVANYDLKISKANKEIELIKVKIAQLKAELKKAEAELKRQKGLLQANMRALYKRGGASPVELLVASDNFGQFIDEQEYLERIKAGIQDSAEKIISLKQQIQEKKVEQEGLLKKQQAAKDSLAEARRERAQLLAKTEGKEARYRAIVAKQRAELAKAEAAMAAALGNGSYKVAPVGPVGAGGIVGSVGNTGLSSGPHLHLEVRRGGGTTNPNPYIQVQPVYMPPGWISQGYGNPDPIYMSGYHPGIDYAAPHGSPIRAIDSGYLYRGCSNQLLGTSNNAYGYVAIVQHNGGHISVYAHMSGGPAACNYNTYY